MNNNMNNTDKIRFNTKQNALGLLSDHFPMKNKVIDELYSSASYQPFQTLVTYDIFPRFWHL